MNYKIKTTPAFDSQFKKLDPSVQKLILKWIKNNLSTIENPQSRGKALVGNLKGYWRYRIGNYRLVVEIVEDECIIFAIDVAHRGSIYKK